MPKAASPTLWQPRQWTPMLCSLMLSTPSRACPCRTMYFYIRNNSNTQTTATGPKSVQQQHVYSIIRSPVIQQKVGMLLKINSDMLTFARDTIAPGLLATEWNTTHWHVTEQIDKTRHFKKLSISPTMHSTYIVMNGFMHSTRWRVNEQSKTTWQHFLGVRSNCIRHRRPRAAGLPWRAEEKKKWIYHVIKWCKCLYECDV
jgi:hypothetical protein